MVPSPLTKGQSVIVTSIQSSELIDLYQEKLGLDVSRFFEDAPSISLYRCLDSGYGFFHPFELAGDDAFYRNLQTFDWYYMPWKWEHEITLRHIKDGDKVLEVGSGFGGFLEGANQRISGTEFVGLELNASAIEESRKKGCQVHHEFVQDHAEKRSGYYDVVCSFQVLEHVADVRSFLEANIQCLRPGGKLIICVPNNDSYIKWDDQNVLNMPPHHMGLWNKESLNALTDLFGLRHESTINEPMQEYHLEWYLNLLDRQLPRVMLPIFYRLKIRKALREIIRRFPLLIKGHSILTVLTKS